MIRTEQDLARMYTNLEGEYIILNETSQEFGMAVGGVKPISKETHDILKNACSILYEFNLFKRKTEELRLNYESILNSEQSWISKLSTSEGEKSTALQEPIFIDINRRLTNFIVSLKTLIEDLLIKHKLPKIFDTDKVENFKKIVSMWYDSKISYKFFIRLRDYAVHYNLPIQIVRFNYDFDKEREIPINVNYTVEFRKSSLFNNSTFKSKLEDDLRSYNHTFPLYPFLDEINFIFDEILIAILNISDGRYLDAVNLIENNIDIPNKVTVSVGRVIRDGDTIGPSTELFNMDSMELIKRLTRK